MTGEPVIPSPTTGSSSVLARPIFTGQPGRKALPPEAVPVGLIAYRRLLPNDSAPVADSATSDAVFGPPALIGGSPPSPAAYSSFVPTTISGRPSPVMSPTVGVSTIAPWLSSGPVSGLNVTARVVGLTDATLSASTASTGKPGTGRPSSLNA